MEELLKQTVPILRYRGGEIFHAEDQVIRERDFTVWLNGVCVESGACMPEYWEELALGFLLTEGFLSAPDEISSVSADGESGRIDVAGVSHPQGNHYPALSAPAWTPEVIMATAGRFLEGTSLFRTTGTVHSALITVDGASYSCQCIGRHNAINKAVGMAMRAGAALARAVLYTSGRLPVSMAEKVVRAGIPLVVSRSAPTDAALALAGRCGLTVIGFARGDRMNLYLPTSH